MKFSNVYELERYVELTSKSLTALVKTFEVMPTVRPVEITTLVGGMVDDMIFLRSEGRRLQKEQEEREATRSHLISVEYAKKYKMAGNRGYPGSTGRQGMQGSQGVSNSAVNNNAETVSEGGIILLSNETQEEICSQN